MSPLLRHVNNNNIFFHHTYNDRCDIKYFSVIEIFDKKVINQAEYHIFYHRTNNQYKNVISSKSTTEAQE